MEAEVECDHGVPYDLVNRLQKIDLAKKGLKQYGSYPSMPALLPFSHHQNLVHRSNLAASEDTDPRRMQVRIVFAVHHDLEAFRDYLLISVTENPFTWDF